MAQRLELRSLEWLVRIDIFVEKLNDNPLLLDATDGESVVRKRRDQSRVVGKVFQFSEESAPTRTEGHVR